MCVNTPQRKLQLNRHSCDSPSLCSVTKHTYRRKKPVYIVHKVCQSTRPHAFSQSHLPIERHTSAHAHTRAQTHEEKGLFSLHVVMLVNLLTGTANRGNLPSCSCVLRETLETVEISLTLFSSWLWLQKQLGHSGMRRWGRVRCFSITLPHQSRSSPLKRAAGEKKKKTCGTKIGPGLWKSILLLTWGASTKAISYFTIYTQFLRRKKKKHNPSISEQYELSISQSRFLLFLCPFLSSLCSIPHLWCGTPSPHPQLLLNENCLLLGFSRRRGRYRHIFTSFTFLLKEMFFPLTSRIDRSVRWNRKAISWQKWIPLPLPCTLLRY